MKLKNIVAGVAASGLLLVSGCSDNCGFKPSCGYGINNCTPNPFETRAVVSYNVQEVGEVSFKVVDFGGRVVTDFVDTSVNPGENRCELDGSSLENGRYNLILYVDGDRKDNETITKI